jgi:predicted PurR-regulated permease PerM
MQEIRFPFYSRLTFILLIIVLIIYLLTIGKGIFVPLLFSLLLAFLLYQPARYLEKRLHTGKEWAALISLIGFVILVGSLVYFITFQVLEFSGDLPLLQQKTTDWINSTQQWIIREYHIDSGQQLEYLHNFTTQLLSFIANSLGAIFIGVGEFIFWMVLVFIYTFFIMSHRTLLLNFILRLFPLQDRVKVKSVVMETRNVTNYYLQGLLIEFVVVSAANSLMFYVVGAKYALLLGVLTALLNIIPYLGIVIGCLLTALVTLTHGSPSLALEAVALLFLLHVLDANILLPRVIGMRMKINSLITIISVLIGSVIWGISGMFLAIPLCAMLKIIFDNVQSLEPWGMLMGAEDTEDKLNRK